jgi:hypothetical protein
VQTCAAVIIKEPSLTTFIIKPEAAESKFIIAHRSSKHLDIDNLFFMCTKDVLGNMSLAVAVYLRLALLQLHALQNNDVVNNIRKNTDIFFFIHEYLL